MANPLYQQIQSQNQQNQISNQFSTFMKNPIGFLANNGLNIPQQYQNDPKGIIQYLLNNGTFSQAQYNQALQQVQSMGIKL